jgi:hypothetical protein
MDRRTLLTALFGSAFTSACASRHGPAPRADTAPSLRFDYSAAELLIDAYQRTSISDADIDALLANRGVLAMVENTIKYLPQPVSLFGAALREYVETRQISAGRFGLITSAGRRPQAQAALGEIKRREDELLARIRGVLAPVWPGPRHMTATCHFVMAGASDGFVLDDDARPDCFVAIDRAEGAGDIDGVIINAAHELYHVGQKTARSNAGLFQALSITRAPPLARLLVTVLDEGSANYAVDPTRMSGAGPYFAMWRERFERNSAADRVPDNFALFDRLFAALARGAMNWSDAYDEGFGGANDARLYFVGYEMCKAMEGAYGPRRVRDAFAQRPEIFFRDYVELSRASGSHIRFAPEVEARLHQPI